MKKSKIQMWYYPRKKTWKRRNCYLIIGTKSRGIKKSNFIKIIRNKIRWKRSWLKINWNWIKGIRILIKIKTSLIRYLIIKWRYCSLQINI